jgi:hypothetical protein
MPRKTVYDRLGFDGICNEEGLFKPRKNLAMRARFFRILAVAGAKRQRPIKLGCDDANW